MKKTFHLIVLSILTVAVNGQNNTELDIKNGFKDFQIGDDYTKWKDSMYELYYENPSSVPTGSNLYKYTGSCCQQIFEINLKEIRLTFYKNKLVVIDLVTENFKKIYNLEYTVFNQKGYKELNQSLASLFGKPGFYDTPENQPPVYIVTGWAGKKNALLSRYNYIGTQEGDYATISFYDIAYNRLVNSKGF